MKSAPDSIKNKHQNTGDNDMQEPARIVKPASRTNLLKFITPCLLVLLIAILIIRYFPVYREKQKDIRQYNAMMKNYRAVEFDFYDEKDNPILKDEKYKNHQEKEKFVREYNKLSEEIRSSPGLEKARKIFDYVWTKYVEKKEYVEKQKHCVMYLEKDSTYSAPLLKSRSELKIEKEKSPWKISSYHENKYFKNHYLVYFSFGGLYDSSEEYGLEKTDPSCSNRLVAINRNTFMTYELADSRGDWIRYNRAKFRNLDDARYNALDTHTKKVESFNKVVERENINIDSPEKVRDYMKFFISIYYRDAGSIYCLDEESPRLYMYDSYLDIIPFILEDRGKYYKIVFTTLAVRYERSQYEFPYTETAIWYVKSYKDGRLEADKQLQKARDCLDLWEFF